MLMLLTADFFKINLLNISFRNTIRVSKGLDPDHEGNISVCKSMHFQHCKQMFLIILGPHQQMLAKLYSFFGLYIGPSIHLSVQVNIRVFRGYCFVLD